MAGKIYETAIKLSAQVAKSFKPELLSAAKAIKSLGIEAAKLAETKAAAASLAKLQRASVDLEKKQRAAAAELARLRAEVAATEKPSAALKAQLAGAAKAAAAADRAYMANAAAIVKMDAALRQAGVDTSKLSAEQVRLAVNLTKTERAAAAAARMQKGKAQIGAALKKAGGQVKDLATLGAAGAGAVVAAAAVPLAQFAKFQKGMAEVSTLVDTSKVSMPELTQGVRDLAREFGADHVDTAKALYSTISSGVSDTAKAMDLLRIANKLAVGGSTDVETSVTGLTSSMNAYAAAQLTATQAADAFFVASAIGQATPEALANSIGQIAPTAVSAGVSFDDLTAAIGTITTVIPSTSEAVSGLRGVLTAVLDPSKEARDEAKRLKIQFSATALKTMGLKKFIEQLSKAEGFGAESAAKLFGRVEAGNAVMVLSGNNMETFNGAVDQMAKKAGATDAAFAKMKDGLEQQAKVVRAKANDIAITIGSKLAPIAVDALQKISKWVDDNKNKIEAWATQGAMWIETKLVPGVQKFAAQLWPVIRGLAEMTAKVADAVGGWGNFALIIGAIRLAPLAVAIVQLSSAMVAAIPAVVAFVAPFLPLIAVAAAIATIAASVNELSIDDAKKIKADSDAQFAEQEAARKASPEYRAYRARIAAERAGATGGAASPGAPVIPISSARGGSTTNNSVTVNVPPGTSPQDADAIARAVSAAMAKQAAEQRRAAY